MPSHETVLEVMLHGLVFALVASVIVFTIEQLRKHL